MTSLPRELIKARAQMDILRVLRALGIHDQPRGSSLSICNPVRGEKNPSLQIWVKPGYEGAWKDHGAGLQGDVFDLVAYFNGWSGADGFAKACDWLAVTLGLADASIPQSEQARLRAQDLERADRRIKEQAEKDETARRAAMAIYLKSLKGDLLQSGAAIYLKARGIDLKKLKRPPGALGCLGAHPHRESGRVLPCMVACLQDAKHIRAVHRTWLTPDCTRKASAIGVKPARKIWPNFSGSFIALSRGASDLPWKKADEAGIADDLVLVEGIEKGLAIAVADASPRVWAFGALANLAHVPVPACADRIIVWKDNDHGNDRARALLERGLDHLHTFGRPVSVVSSPIGKDADELLKAGEDDGDEE